MRYEEKRRLVLPSSRFDVVTRSSQSRSGARGRRHSGLLEAAGRMDLALDAAARRALSDWIREQYQTDFGVVPIGFVATCHLGPPYADHRVDLFGSIVEHYAAHEAMPEPFESARMLARNSAYAYVEVFSSGEVVAVKNDGAPV